MSVTKDAKLRLFLSQARSEVGSALTVQKLQVLLEIMRQPGIEQQQIIERTKQTRSAVSKTLADFSGCSSRKASDSALIESRISATNRVHRELYPTARGKIVWAKLMEAFD